MGVDVVLECTGKFTDRAGGEMHLAAGARVLTVREQWTVMSDPVGRVYCRTDRSPARPAST